MRKWATLRKPAIVVQHQNPVPGRHWKVQLIEPKMEIDFYDCGNLNVLLSESDLKFGNWSHAFGFLHSL